MNRSKKTFIKSNILSRQRSLIENSNQTSLFHEKNLAGYGVYLQPHQDYSDINKATEAMILIVFSGTGELSITEYDAQAPLLIQILPGDLLVVPPQALIKILNTGKECLILTKIMID